jgi:hypothetical protein
VEPIDNAEQSQIGVKLKGDRPEAGNTARQNSSPLGVCDRSHDQGSRCDASAERHRPTAACEIGDGSPPADWIRRDFGKLLIVVFEQEEAPWQDRRRTWI